MWGQLNRLIRPSLINRCLQQNQYRRTINTNVNSVLRTNQVQSRQLTSHSIGSRGSEDQYGHNESYSRPLLLLFTTGLVCWHRGLNQVDAKDNQQDDEQNIVDNYGKFKEGLRMYTASEVSAHDSREKRVWIVFRR